MCSPLNMKSSPYCRLDQLHPIHASSQWVLPPCQCEKLLKKSVPSSCRDQEVPQPSVTALQVCLPQLRAMPAAMYLAVCPLEDRSPSFIDGVWAVRILVGWISRRKRSKGAHSVGILNVAFYALFQTGCWFWWGELLLILLFPPMVWKLCFEFLLLEWLFLSLNIWKVISWPRSHSHLLEKIKCILSFYTA